MKKLLSLFTALLLCTAMWGATYKTFYKVQGALYQGINVDFTTNKNMFVPNGATVTYSTFDGKPADWWANGEEKIKGASSYTTGVLADGSDYKYQIKNYTGYDAQDPKIDYMYGTVDNKNYFLRAGSGTMYMMSMANAYCVCTEHATASNVGKYYVDNKSMLTLNSTDAKNYGTSMKYGTNFSYDNYGDVFAYEMLVDNPGEMYIDYIVLPIYASSKDNTMGIANMIPGEAILTLTLYPIELTLASDGKYSYTRKTTPITTVTATANDFKADGDNLYRGTVKFTPKNPLLISGDFVARLTWGDGCEFGLITDDNNLQNFTTFYLFRNTEGKETKSYMWSSTSANASISYHAMFPVLEKKDKIETLEFASTGEESKEVAIKSNINPSTSTGFTIDFGDANWISMTGITYSDGEYKLSGTNTLTFKADANTTGETREATITLKHHLKELTYTVKQVPEVSSISILNSKSEEIEDLSLKATETETLIAEVLPETTTQEVTWVSEDETIAEVDAEGKVTAVGAGTTKIKAISADPDKYAECEVTVTPKVDVYNAPNNNVNLIAPSAGGDVTFTNKTTAYKQIQYDITGKGFVKDDWNVTFSEGCDWVEYKLSKGQDNPNRSVITLNATKSNTTGTGRNATVTIEAYGYKFEYPIIQESLPSAYYEVPTGAFFAGMTDNSSAADPTFYVPYLHNSTENHEFSSDDNGKWTSASGTKGPQKNYKYNNKITRYNIPQLQVENKINYQYGGSGTEYNSNLYFYVGDSEMRYMTPARLWADLTVANYTQGEGGYADGYKPSESDKMGVYFNNIETMYIDGISIPISAGSTAAAKEKTKDDLFGENASVTVTIYHAKIEGETRQKDTDKPAIWTGTLTDEDIVFTPLSKTESYRGALNATFEAPISINGAFVVELSDMSDCNFYVLSDKSNGKNKWGYYIQKGKVSFPGNYCLAVSVHAMFPALEKKDNKTELVFASTGVESKEVVIISNIDPKSEDFTIDFGGAGWISEGDITYDVTSGESTLTFTAAANDGDTRSTTITLTHHLKTLTYTVSQEAAPEPAPTYIREGRVGNYGTLCFPYTPTQDVTGADFYKVLWFNEAAMDLVLEQITGQPEAAVPYIFQYTDTKMVWAYDNTKDPEDISEDGDNGLYGVASAEGYTVSTEDATAGTYLLSNNQIVKAAVGSHAAQYRAYLKLSEVSKDAPVGPATAPRIHMTVPGNGAPTNLNGLNSNTKAHKILKDGQLLIIRDTKTYNAQGIEL